MIYSSINQESAGLTVQLYALLDNTGLDVVVPVLWDDGVLALRGPSYTATPVVELGSRQTQPIRQVLQADSGETRGDGGGEKGS